MSEMETENHEAQSGGFTASQLQDIVEAALTKERAAAKAQMDAMATQIATLSAAVSGTTPNFVREHGGGVGTRIHETWSQFEQAAMNAAREIPAVAKLAAELASVV